MIISNYSHTSAMRANDSEHRRKSPRSRRADTDVAASIFDAWTSAAGVKSAET